MKISARFSDSSADSDVLILNFGMMWVFTAYFWCPWGHQKGAAQKYAAGSLAGSHWVRPPVSPELARQVSACRLATGVGLASLSHRVESDWTRSDCSDILAGVSGMARESHVIISGGATTTPSVGEVDTVFSEVEAWVASPDSLGVPGWWRDFCMEFSSQVTPYDRPWVSRVSRVSSGAITVNQPGTEPAILDRYKAIEMRDECMLKSANQLEGSGGMFPQGNFFN